MKKILSFFLVGWGSYLLLGCGSGSNPGNSTPGLSKSVLHVALLGMDAPISTLGAIEFKIDYDQSVVKPMPDINENAKTSVSLSEAMSGNRTYVVAHDDGDILTLNLLNANGFDTGEKTIEIDFSVLNETPGVRSYQIVLDTFKLFDLNGERISGVDPALKVTNE
ncbi:MAG: hypothetical protein QME90_00780 [Thermodesulfobacteriota bacterium]|nr:hypothetical protein [Thermodesulfobacteriota bacterium]